MNEKKTKFIKNVPCKKFSRFSILRYFLSVILCKKDWFWCSFFSSFFLSSFHVEYFFIFFSLCFEMPCILSLKFNPLVLLHLMDFLFLSLSWIYCILDTIRNAKNFCNNCLWCKKCLDLFFVFIFYRYRWMERKREQICLSYVPIMVFFFFFFFLMCNKRERLS